MAYDNHTCGSVVMMESPKHAANLQTDRIITEFNHTNDELDVTGMILNT